MARPLRIEYPGALYHVTCRGNERRRVFHDNRDRETFLSLLGKAVKRFGWKVSAWALMGNHIHLVVETPEANLSRGMQWLNGSYASWFNNRHDRVGHLFQGRFKSFLIEKETYFARVLRYVVLNPVRAGMVSHPEAYRWTSYRATAGLAVGPEWFDRHAVLPLFGPCKERAELEYRNYVLVKIQDRESLWTELSNGLFLGNDPWRREMRKTVESRPRSTDHPHRQLAVGRPPMHLITAAVAQTSGHSTESLLTGTGEGSLRRLAAWLGWHEGLLTLRSIAAGLRLRSEGYISNLIRRCDEELGTDEVLLGRMDRALAALRT